MNTIERIKAEIKRLKEEQLSNNGGKITGPIKIDADELEHFLNTLETNDEH